MPVSGTRAAAAVREAMREAGLGFGDHEGSAVEGWAEPNRYNTLGFGLVPLRDGQVRWCVHLAGKPHLRYVNSRDPDNEEREEPVNPSILHGRVRAVFEGMGLDVREVLTGGFQTMWDDTVSYHVTTARPAWLGRYDPTNAMSPGTSGPVLHSFALARASRGILLDRQRLPGYLDGDRVLLTREAVEFLVSTHAEAVEASRAYRRDGETGTASLGHDGVLMLGRAGFTAARCAPTRVTNHWGDAVEAWPVPPRLFDPRLPFAPDVPFTVEGETVTSLPFAAWDAQHGDEAPWHEPSTPPRP